MVSRDPVVCSPATRRTVMIGPLTRAVWFSGDEREISEHSARLLKKRGVR